MAKYKKKNISISEVLDIAANYKRELKDHKLTDEPNYCKNKILKQEANILIIDIENIESVTIHPLDPRSISHEAVSESSQFTEIRFEMNL